jgi:tight adherence protein C
MATALSVLSASLAVVVAGATRARGRRSVPSAREVAGREAVSLGRERRTGRSQVRRSVVLVGAGASLAAVVILGPGSAVVAVVVAALVRVELVRRARHRRRRASDGAFPDLVDLFRIAAAAGHPVHRCLEVVAPRSPAALRVPLAAAVVRVQRGVPLADALHVLGPELGTSGPVLTDALQTALRTGAPLGPVLDRVVLVARDRRTRSAQEAARRLPVTLLFPLVCCVLPAFGLLGVVPLLAGSLDSLAP